MYALLVLLLTLVPSPKATPKPVEVCPIVGTWSIDWGENCKQTTIFREDGTCLSPEYGSGKWTISDDGNTIFFSEQNDTARYAMSVNLLDGIGDGCRIPFDYESDTAIPVKIRKGEYLHRIPPRVFE